MSDEIKVGDLVRYKSGIGRPTQDQLYVVLLLNDRVPIHSEYGGGEDKEFKILEQGTGEIYYEWESILELAKEEENATV